MSWLIPILIIALSVPVGAVVGIVTALFEIWIERGNDETDE